MSTTSFARTAARARRRLSRRHLTSALAMLGPGVIAASAGNDAGGIATYASAGAQFRYRMLFVLLLVSIGLVVVQDMTARLGAGTGRGLISLIRTEVSARLAIFVVGCLLVANVGLVISEFAGIGTAFELFGVPRTRSVPVAALLLWALVTFGSRDRVQLVLLSLSLVFVGYLVAAVLAHPNWSEVADHAVVPRLLGSRSFLVLAVALVGTTITPYMQVYQAAAMAGSATPGRLRRERFDSAVGAGAAGLVAMAILVATAATIGGTGPLRSAADAARGLEPVAGRAAALVFGIGLLGASALAAAVLPLATTHALAEGFGRGRDEVGEGVVGPATDGRRFRIVFTALVVVGAGAALAPGNLVDLLVGAQVLNGLVAPIFLVLVLLLANRGCLLGIHANSQGFRVAGAITVAIVGLLATVVVGLTVGGWLGLG